MKKKILLAILAFMFLNISACTVQAAFVSSSSYRHEQNKIINEETKQIKKLFELHLLFANKHDLQGLSSLYYDKYINNDGFDKKTYLKSVAETWDGCEDLTYSTKILSIDINGNYANVSVEEKAVGTLLDTIDSYSVAGEIHAMSNSIYRLIKVNGRWLISGETMLSDKSYLLYGDARFMNIELYAPNQVSSGEVYTVTVKVDADKNTVIVGSIEHDPVKYPAKIPDGPIRTVPKTNVLERLIVANTDNINEYAVTSLAISKAQTDKYNNYKVYMAGLASIMQRVNVVPKNEHIDYGEEK